MIETKKTFCRVCHAACPMEIDVEDERQIVAVRGDRADPLFEGYTCIKGRQLADQYHGPGRLRGPLRRRPDGTFESVASSEALDEIAAQIASIVEQHGPRAVASYTGTGAYQNSVGVPTAMVSSYAAGGGLQGTNPFVKLREAKARGLKLVVIDPRRSELATQADVWLQVKPGEDPTLLAAITNVVLSRGLHDEAFRAEHVDPGQVESLAAAVAPFTLDYAAARCVLPRQTSKLPPSRSHPGPAGAPGLEPGRTWHRTEPSWKRSR